MLGDFETIIKQKIASKKSEGTYKAERILRTNQGPAIWIEGKDIPVLNFCANNYLGLANHPAIVKAAHEALDTFGFGMASVRFICGTDILHKQLESVISLFLGTEDTILYTSCFDANGGLFESIMDIGDVIISATLNHASIIDGIRLSKAERLLYPAEDMDELERILRKAQSARLKIVVTDGVFSMEGNLAPLDNIAPLCKKYGAILTIDDSHATGFLGPTGKGTAEELGVLREVDIFTSTLGKTLGGACGGFVSGRKLLIDWLRNTSRPYLFSNSLPPSLVAGALKAFEIIQGEEGTCLRKKIKENSAYFRQKLTALGFKINPGIHPIIPIMIGDAVKAAGMAEELLNEGIYVISFSYPVVPKDAARIRVQISAAHSREHLDTALDAFAQVGKKYGIAE